METIRFFWFTLTLLFSFSQWSFAQRSYQNQALMLHNFYRGRHQAEPLQMDNELNSIAVRCAQYYAQRHSVDHSCPYRGELGENLFYAEGKFWNFDTMAERAVERFYSEESNYDYANPGHSRNGENFLHFTAMMWKGTEKLGFGAARRGRYCVTVALYSPHGNVNGSYAENV